MSAIYAVPMQKRANKRPWRPGLIPLVALLAIGCALPPESAPPAPAAVEPEPPARLALASPSPVPSPALLLSPSPAAWREDFERVAIGQVPEDFIDVTLEGQMPAWVYPGRWAVQVDEAGNKVLRHDDERRLPGVSFRRYRGEALGKPNGEMPPVYFAEITVRPIRSSFNYPPTGDQGIPLYYLRHDTYLELVIKPKQIEVWEANGAEPGTIRGWKRLHYQALETGAGDVRRVGALVDVPQKRFVAYLNGEPIATVTSELLSPQPAYVALRAIGNVVSFDDFRLEAR